MTRLLVLLPLLAASAAHASDLHNRLLHYPAPTQSGATPPVLRLHPGGALRLTFEDTNPSLEERAIFVTRPDAWLLTVDAGGLSVFSIAEAAGEGTLFVRTSEGRTLTFSVVLVPPHETADALVTVTAESAPALCTTQDDESTPSVLDALAGAKHLSVSTPHHVDKQHGLWFRLLDSLHVGETTYLRLRIDNRDSSGPPWVPGQAQVTVVDASGHREALVSKVTVVTASLDPGESTTAAVSYTPPQVSPGTRIELLLSERAGSRHVLIERLPQ